VSSKGKKLSAEARRLKIRELLQENDCVTVSQIAQTCRVSIMTVHRDLDKLQNDGQVRRTRGGALPAERMDFEFDFAIRRQLHNNEKKLIARKACEFIQPGQKLILDSGTTTLELAYVIKDFENIVVITPSLAVASVLQFSKGIETVLLGGVIRQGSPHVTGIVTEAVLEMFTVDIAFKGADGIGLDGAVYNADMSIAKVDHKIRHQAQKTYILADSSKIGKTALIKSGYIYEIGALITDYKVNQRHLASFKKLGANVIVSSEK
jgi:DeoR/GlpR family transcriptional regulator of sugar metabolism